jgi:hypothetical protein
MEVTGEPVTGSVPDAVWLFGDWFSPVVPAGVPPVELLPLELEVVDPVVLELVVLLFVVLLFVVLVLVVLLLVVLVLVVLFVVLVVFVVVPWSLVAWSVDVLVVTGVSVVPVPVLVVLVPVVPLVVDPVDVLPFVVLPFVVLPWSSDELSLLPPTVTRLSTRAGSSALAGAAWVVVTASAAPAGAPPNAIAPSTRPDTTSPAPANRRRFFLEVVIMRILPLSAGCRLTGQGPSTQRNPLGQLPSVTPVSRGLSRPWCHKGNRTRRQVRRLSHPDRLKSGNPRRSACG